MAVVEAYLDLTCAYSYLASSQLDKIAAATGARFHWYPVIATELFAPGRNPFRAPPCSPQYDPSYRHADVMHWAQYYQIPYRDPRGRIAPDAHLLTRAAIAAGPSEKRGPMMKRLFAAVFADPRQSVGATDLFNFAADVGLDPWTFREALGGPIIEAERLSITERARSSGAFGAPFFVAGSRTYFGNDRLVLLAHDLMEKPLA